MKIEDVRRFMRLDRIADIKKIEDLYLIGREVNVDTLELVGSDGKCECGAEGGYCEVSTEVDGCGDSECVVFCPNCGKVDDVMSEIDIDSEDVALELMVGGLDNCDEYEDM